MAKVLYMGYTPEQIATLPGLNASVRRAERVMEDEPNLRWTEANMARKMCQAMGREYDVANDTAFAVRWEFFGYDHLIDGRFVGMVDERALADAMSLWRFLKVKGYFPSIGGDAA